MNIDALKAAVLAILAQTGSIAVGFGVGNNQVGKWSAISVAIVNAAALIAHAWHAQTAAQLATATAAPSAWSPPPPPPGA